MSSGDALRAEVNERTDLGKEIESTLAAGSTLSIQNLEENRLWVGGRAVGLFCECACLSPLSPPPLPLWCGCALCVGMFVSWCECGCVSRRFYVCFCVCLFFVSVSM